MASQILLNPIGSGGDVFPFLALGRELQKRVCHLGADQMQPHIVGARITAPVAIETGYRRR